MNLPVIEEIIVVEGRDDTIAVRQAVDAVTIETHGFGIREETWELIRKADQTKGIIVFTDPDTAGDQIRRRIMERFPDAGEAFLDRELATKDGDIGIENASAEAIRQALSRAHRAIRPKAGRKEDAPASGGPEEEAPEEDAPAPAPFTSDDLFRWGLDGKPGAAEKRREVGRKLGIGQATAKTFLKRLNRFGLSREEIEQALED